VQGSSKAHVATGAASARLSAVMMNTALRLDESEYVIPRPNLRPSRSRSHLVTGSRAWAAFLIHGAPLLVPSPNPKIRKLRHLQTKNPDDEH